MINLGVLKDMWTEEGARSVFAEIVNQCVRSQYPGARAVRPDPGDDGVDTFVGEIEGDLQVWQSKYFCDGVGATQQSQIRDSWKACTKSKLISRVVRWTLCIPEEMSLKEISWWQKWLKKESAKCKCQIELWSKTDFVKFSARDDLAAVFAVALQRGVKHSTLEAAISAMRFARVRVNVKKLPDGDHLRDAIFVRKLEAAGIKQHRAPRTAFYNFELLRAAIEQGGNPEEMSALEDLQEHVYELWEREFNERSPDGLGKPLFVAVDRAIEQEDSGRLKTSLPTDVIHKKGGLHYWADLCEAGWTADFKVLGREEPEEVSE